MTRDPKHKPEARNLCICCDCNDKPEARNLCICCDCNGHQVEIDALEESRR